MFTFYNEKSIISFFKTYDTLLHSFEMDNHRYFVTFDYQETDQELEIGNFITHIKNENDKVVFKISIPTTYHKAMIMIKKMQLDFIKNHHISLPYFTRNYKKEIISYHIRNTKFELIQKLHSIYEIKEKEEMQKIALKKHYNDNVLNHNISIEFSKKEEIEGFYLLLSAVLETLNYCPNQYFIYVDYKEHIGKFTISIKNQYENYIFQKDLFLNKQEASKIINKFRNDFIENQSIFLPSIHKKELNDLQFHHIKSTKFELIIPIQNDIDYKNAIDAQSKAMMKLQQNFENAKIYTKKNH